MLCHKDFEPIFRLDFSGTSNQSFVYIIISSVSLLTVERNGKRMRAHAHIQREQHKLDFVRQPERPKSILSKTKTKNRKLNFYLNSKRSTYFDWLLKKNYLLLTFAIVFIVSVFADSMVQRGRADTDKQAKKKKNKQTTRSCKCQNRLAIRLHLQPNHFVTR